MKNYMRRMAWLLFGLLLYALGLYCTIQANIGLAPWNALAQGVSIVTGASFGTTMIAIGIVILGIIALMKERIGVGTICNTLLIGTFVDLFDLFNLIPMLDNFYLGILLLLLGQVLICVGTRYYVGASLGAGPRDSLMVAVGKRLPKLPIGVVRALVEGMALLIGWLLGASVGIGTVISVLGIGVILQAVCAVMRFDIKAVKHESLLDTWRAVRALAKPAEEPGQVEEQDG